VGLAQHEACDRRETVGTAAGNGQAWRRQATVGQSRGLHQGQEGGPVVMVPRGPAREGWPLGCYHGLGLVDNAVSK
jgi:hypothetical protein